MQLASTKSQPPEPPSSLPRTAAPLSRASPGVWAFPCPLEMLWFSALSPVTPVVQCLSCSERGLPYCKTASPASPVGTPPAPWGPHQPHGDMQVVPSRAHQHAPLGQHPSPSTTSLEVHGETDPTHYFFFCSLVLSRS